MGLGKAYNKLVARRLEHRTLIEGFPASGTSLCRAHLHSYEQHHFNNLYIYQITFYRAQFPVNLKPVSSFTIMSIHIPSKCAGFLIISPFLDFG
jgi:hypothetical protein